MTYNEIITLTEKGFKPEQIMALARADPETTPEELPQETTDDSARDATPEKEETPEDNQEVTALKNEIAELKKQIQAQNIKTQSVDVLPGNRETVEQVLSEFIRPPFDNKTK